MLWVPGPCMAPWESFWVSPLNAGIQAPGCAPIACFHAPVLSVQLSWLQGCWCSLQAVVDEELPQLCAGSLGRFCLNPGL